MDLEKIIAHALPGVRLREARALGERTQLLALGNGRRVVLRLAGSPDPWAGDPLTAEAATLRALAGEIDLPLPALLAADLAGASGTPYLLLTYLEGETLESLPGTIGESQLFAIGRELGMLLARVHTHSAPAYGSLPVDPGAWPATTDMHEQRPRRRSTRRHQPEERPRLADRTDDLDYLRRRLEQNLSVAVATGAVDAQQQQTISEWIALNVAPSGLPACLVHGGVLPEHLLVRRREHNWRLAGLVGWGFAQGWRPGWDHATLLGAFADPHFFALRTGYGTAYEEQTERRYDQLREMALRPYHLVFYAEAGRWDIVAALTSSPVEGDLAA